MKKLLIAALIAMPIGAYAQQDKISFCTGLDQIFNYAASYRDARMSPQQVLEVMEPMKTAQFPEGLIKSVINQVFFDEDFSRMSTQQIVPLVMKTCLHPPKRFEPLQ
jgi:hypothetical protein